MNIMFIIILLIGVILVADRECKRGYWILAILGMMVFVPWVFKFLAMLIGGIFGGALIFCILTCGIVYIVARIFEMI